MTVFHVRDRYRDAFDLLLPQFFCRVNSGNIFGGEEDVLISRELLTKNFSLADKDTAINFKNMRHEMVAMDIYDNEDFPRYKFFSDAEIKAFLEHFDTLSDAAQIRQCAAKISTAVDKNQQTPPTPEVVAYVTRIVEHFDREQIRDSVINTNAYAEKIREAIKSMKTVHAKKIFTAQINARKIFVKPSYKLPAEISPTKFNSWSNSLYEAEESVNSLEAKVAAELSRLENVLWWHRNRSQKEFCLNGFINHYPDFIVHMKSGATLLVESKGDDRDNSDSKQKLELGKIWESKVSSDSFGYFMVFDSNPIDGALTLDEFVSCIKEL